MHFGFGGDAVGDDLEEHSAEVQGMSVGQVSAVVQTHREHGVAGLEKGEIDGHVGGTSGVGLETFAASAPKSLQARSMAILSTSSTNSQPL